MKRYSKILIKKDNDIKAILDLDGKVLTSDKSLKGEIERLMREDIVTQKEEDGKRISSLTKITTEKMLFTHLYMELEMQGYSVE